MNSGTVIVRFAPPPSGFMHADNLLCAMLSYLSAKSKSGKFIIRIEDLDEIRCPRSVALDDSGYIIADEKCRTKKVRQLTTAVADGASAAMAACKYLG